MDLIRPNGASTASQSPSPMLVSSALALVWAADDERAAAALEHLHHSLWPYWYRYTITEVRHVPRGGLCPLRMDDPAVLAFARRERWAWVLVPVGTNPDACPHRASIQSDSRPSL